MSGKTEDSFEEQKTDGDKNFEEVFGASFDEMPLRQQIETAYDYYEKPQNGQMYQITRDSAAFGEQRKKDNPLFGTDETEGKNYPIVRKDKRNIFNSAVENFVKKAKTFSDDNTLSNQMMGAIGDLGENYINMINANYKSTPEMQNQGKTIDNYYHCIGNYDAAKRGPWGSATATGIGLGREVLDYPKNLVKGSSFSKTNDDFLSDLHVNADGQAMAKSNRYNSAFDACDKYRPYLYDPFERFKYYRK